MVRSIITVFSFLIGFCHAADINTNDSIKIETFELKNSYELCNYRKYIMLKCNFDAFKHEVKEYDPNSIEREKFKFFTVGDDQNFLTREGFSHDIDKKNIAPIHRFKLSDDGKSINLGATIALFEGPELGIFDRETGNLLRLHKTESKNEKFIDATQDLNGDLVLVTSAQNQLRFNQNNDLIESCPVSSLVALADKFPNFEEVNNVKISRVVAFAEAYYAVFGNSNIDIYIFDKECKHVKYFKSPKGGIHDISIQDNGDLVLLYRINDYSYLSIIKVAQTDDRKAPQMEDQPPTKTPRSRGVKRVETCVLQ